VTRMGNRVLRALAASMVVLPCTAGGQAQLPPSLEFRVPKSPTVATGDAGSFLAYELHVTNLSTDPLALRSVEVFDAADTTRNLLVLGDSALRPLVSRVGANVPASARLQIAPGSRAMVYLWIAVVKDNPPPALRHRLTVHRLRQDSAAGQLVPRDTVRIAGAAINVDRNTARIGPPLRGAWLAANGPSNLSGHRRTMLGLGGATAIAQRFGIDFLQVDDSGRTFRDDGSRKARCNAPTEDRARCREPKNEEFLAWGEEAIAVADGRVAQIKDGLPENVGGPMARAVPVDLETVAGNYVLIEIAPSKYAFYAHLQPGSLRVKVGDRVRRGQVVGLVGNSGNSTEPHLHFHIVDGIAPGTSTLGAEGIPYATSFTLFGRCQLSAAGIQCTRTAPVSLIDAMPMQNQLVRFQER
jgi:murein DD-endopeptidase